MRTILKEKKSTTSYVTCNVYLKKKKIKVTCLLIVLK